MALKGDLCTIQLADIFQTLANNQSRGTLVVHDKDSRKHIYFEGGRVTLFSHGKRRSLRLGKILLGRRKITQNELNAALRMQENSREHLGKILVGMGAITEEEMQEALKFQIEEEIYGLFAWKDAHFEFSPEIPAADKPGRTADAISLSLDVHELVMEAARRADEWQTIAEHIHSTKEVYRFTGETSKTPACESLSEEQTAELLPLFDGTRTVEDVSNETAYGGFAVCKALAQLIREESVRPADAADLLDAAEAFAGAGDIDKCLRFYELAASRAPEDIEVQKTVARTYERFGKGHMAAARYNAIGLLYLESGKQELAAEYLERSVTIQPADPDVLRRLLTIYSNLNDARSVIRMGKRLAALYEDLGRQEESRSVYELLLELDPHDMHSRRHLLNILLDGGNFAEAEAHYEKLADDYLSRGQAGRAVEVLRKLLVVRPLRHDVARRIDGMLHRATRRRKRRMLLVAGAMALGLLLLAGAYEYKAHSMRMGLDEAIMTARRHEDYETAAECYQAVINAYPFSITALRASREIADINNKKDLFYGKQVKLLTQSARQEEQEGRLESALGVLDRLREFAREKSLRQYAENEAARIRKYAEEAEALWNLAQKYRRENRLKEVFEYNSRIYWSYPLSQYASKAEFPLLVTSLPGGAEVYADGEPAGTTPHVLYYPPSRPPIIRISQKGFEEVSYDVMQKVTQQPSEGWQMAVELSKTLCWKFATSQPVEAPPAVFRDTLILGGRDGNLYCLQKETGALKWKRQLGLMADVVSQPLLLETRVYAGCFDGSIYCIGAESGRMLWSVKAGGMLRATPTASADGSAVFITSDAGRIMALSSRTGETLWSRTADSGIASSVVPWRDRAFAATLGGDLLCLSQKDGATIWKTAHRGGITGTPAVLGDRIYFGCLNGEMLCLEAETGRLVWRFESRSAIRCSPAFVDGTLIFGNDGGWLIRLSAANGRLMWRFRCKGSIYAAPAITASTSQVVCGTTDGSLYALDLEEGTAAWRYGTQGAIYSSVLAHEGRLYFGSNDNHLYSIEE